MNARWQELFNRVADGIQSEADELELATLLRTSAAARRDFRSFMELHGALQWDSSCLAQGGGPPTGDDDRFDPRRMAAAIVVAALLGAAAAAAFFFPGRHRPVADRATVAETEADGQDTRPAPLGVVTQTRFLVSGEGGRRLEPGQPFEGGRLAIRGGAVELLLRNGVVVVFEGPGEIDFLDEMTAVLLDGNVVVRMPEGADGFRLRAASMEVLDLGTEFAVSVRQGNAIDVQVYDGAVIASGSPQADPVQPPKRLDAGEAARFRPQPEAEPEQLAFRPQRFVRKLSSDLGIPSREPPVRTRDAVRLYGRPEHDSIVVHRAPPVVAIDGRLDEWRAAPGFESTLDGTPDCTERVDGRMMYDDRCLYIAAHVRDPFPLRSIIDPDVDAGFGWRGGSVQVRVSTDRKLGWPSRGNTSGYYSQRGIEPTDEQKEWAKNPRLSHLTMWFHAPTQTPCITIVEGALVGELRLNPAGCVGAFVADADGGGYTMEFAIPWTELGCADDPPRSGDDLAAIWQVYWSDGDGRLPREHMVEIRNRDEPLQINVWERAATWGRAEYR